MNSPVRVPAAALTTQIFSIRGLRLYFPALGPWVVQSVSLPSRSSWFICTQMWDHPVCNPPPCHESCPPRCPSPPLLPVWINVSSLTPWLSDFHIVLFSGSSGRFLFLNLLLSFFWLYEEAQCVYLHLCLGRKSDICISCIALCTWCYMCRLYSDISKMQ